MEEKSGKDKKETYVKKIDGGISIQRDVYTPLQLANYLQLSERYIRDAIKKKTLTAYQKARRLYILHTDVLEWVKSGKD
jgi:excisionase family DNA binding protein